MNLSRKWLNEFVDIDTADRDFAEAMTLSGSKVEVTVDLGAEIENVKVGKILSMIKHPNSDHMWICSIDVGDAEPVQIVTGAWNVHVGDLVPTAVHKAKLPGGKVIEKGKLRGEVSYGMLCSLKELGLDERDFPYAVIDAAAILGDYHPLDKAKPSISEDIKAGDRIYGSVVAASVKAIASVGVNIFELSLDCGEEVKAISACQNIHEGDLVAYNTASSKVCTL